MATMSPSELLDWLEQNQFLTPPQINEIRPIVSAFPDCHALAKELIRRDWLTPYQGNQILQGRHDQLILGNYRVRERIGEGAMGQVFKAWNPRTLRVVAVKTILKELVNSPKTMERFRREVETASQLEHPNIAHVRDADEADGKPFLVMELIEGYNLSQRVKQGGPLPIAEAVEFARQAALGLQHAFEKGIVHRDIKPANLIVTTLKVDGGVLPLVKILDFGLARFDSESDEAARLTQVGRLLGDHRLHFAGTSPERSRRRHSRGHLQPGLHAALPADGPAAVCRRHHGGEVEPAGDGGAAVDSRDSSGGAAAAGRGVAKDDGAVGPRTATRRRSRWRRRWCHSRQRRRMRYRCRWPRRWSRSS